jgi:hypothetical protein
LERKKRQQKTIPRQKLEGPRIKEVFTEDGRHLLSVPELLPKEQLFPKFVFQLIKIFKTCKFLCKFLT